MVLGCVVLFRWAGQINVTFSLLSVGTQSKVNSFKSHIIFSDNNLEVWLASSRILHDISSPHLTLDSLQLHLLEYLI